MASKVDETALAKMGPAQVQGPTYDEFSRFIGDGFASIDTVLLGDPTQPGKQPLYMGELIGPGEPIAMGEPDPKTGEVKMQPTWAFHPMGKVDGKPGVVRNVTHVIPASHVVHHACSRIDKESKEKGLAAIVGIAFVGQGQTRKGYRLNNFRVFEKYVPKAG
jgi:hypothetical protein